MELVRKLIARTGAAPGRGRVLLAAATCLCACQTQPPVDPAPVSAAPVPEVKSRPVEAVRYEAWMGPIPRAAPVDDVSQSALPPVTRQAGPAPAGAGFQQNLDEPAQLAGMTVEHGDVMLSRGKPPLGWSNELAASAGLQAEQMGAYMCSRRDRQDFSARGEAVRIEPPVFGPEGPREARLSARQIVRDWSGSGMGPFGRDNANASRLGCAVRACDGASQIIVCRYG